MPSNNKPYRKKNNRRRRKKMPAKKKAYRNSYAIAKITAPLVPKTRLCFMNYVQKFRLDPQPVNAGSLDVHNSTMAIRTFTINNLKDMDEQTSGLGTPGNMNDQFANHQPRGYTQWGAHYNSMTVVSTKTSIEARNRYVTVQPVSTTAHPLTAGQIVSGTYIRPPEPVAVGFMTSHFNRKTHSDVAGVKFNDLLEQKQCVYRELNDDRQKVSLTHNWSLKKEPTYTKNLKMDGSTSDFAWGSLYEVDILQTNKRHIHVFACPLGIKDNLDPTPIDLVVQVSACVLLSNRNEMDRS
jgi:hypothetical protein